MYIYVWVVNTRSMYWYICIYTVYEYIYVCMYRNVYMYDSIRWVVPLVSWGDNHVRPIRTLRCSGRLLCNGEWKERTVVVCSCGFLCVVVCNCVFGARKIGYHIVLRISGPHRPANVSVRRLRLRTTVQPERSSLFSPAPFPVAPPPRAYVTSWQVCEGRSPQVLFVAKQNLMMLTRSRA